MLCVMFEDGFCLEYVVLIGLLCMYYGVFVDLLIVCVLVMQIEYQCFELVCYGIYLLVSLMFYGDWIIGDLYDYGQDVCLFNVELVDNIMFDFVCDMFGSKLCVVECWQGVYGVKCYVFGSGVFFIICVDDCIIVVLMYSGIGMSVGLVLVYWYMDVFVDGIELL